MKFHSSIPTGLLLAVAIPSENYYGAEATYSIAATDRQEMLVGGAGASCVQGSDIGDKLYRGVPGKGVLLTQAIPLDADSTAVTTAMAQIGTGPTPDEILQTMNSLDQGTENVDNYAAAGMVGIPGPDFELRQNAIVDLDGLHGAWTGNQIGDLYEAIDIFGTTQEHGGNSDDRFAYSAQGNVVANTTVSVLRLGFIGLFDELGDGCDLPEKLMIAMQTVPATDSGDERCIRGDVEPKDAVGTPAAGAFVKVQDAEGNYVIDINVSGDGTVDPTIELREKFDAWRAENPCPGGSTSTVTTEAPKLAETTDAPVPDEVTDPSATTTNAPWATGAPSSSASFGTRAGFSVILAGASLLASPFL